VPLHLEAEQPGDLVQVDCFHIGRLSGTKGRVWQYCETCCGTCPTRSDPWQYWDAMSLQ
jgi:hypothetical protein